MATWTHMDEQGRARMVDVGDKDMTAREAVARGFVYMEAATLRAIVEQQIAKGDVLQVARIAGIMGAKQTPALIPMCHPLEITNVEIHLWPEPEAQRVGIEARVRNHGRTGVEMEALTAVSVAALTVYDMCKSLDRQMRVADIELLYKSGGKSGEYRHPAYQAS
ncbi:MAG: cyclic pyranopterin monophosphate synthase MoaC [Candidatus Tectomicrobia bacterium]|uniref:Cyclic pyranopterin monophosphate synthase n=1 Tax=Tectimicrobiota bacterium TaxID=2528274 RepID=A0A938B0Z1_UNCTE|nr:cyclic pyranopterin monophosphate synthase MoaC [Candidatus Tectomicrobia bacterium]